jgi:hypothetical protein
MMPQMMKWWWWWWILPHHNHSGINNFDTWVNGF